MKTNNAHVRPLSITIQADISECVHTSSKVCSGQKYQPDTEDIHTVRDPSYENIYTVTCNHYWNSCWFFFYILICVSVAEAIVNITHFCCHYRILSCGILPQVAVKLKVIWVHSTNICGHKTVILWYRGSNDKIQDTLRYYHQTIKSQGHWMISQAPSKTKTMMCFIVMKINNYEE